MPHWGINKIVIDKNQAWNKNLATRYFIKNKSEVIPSILLDPFKFKRFVLAVILRFLYIKT